MKSKKTRKTAKRKIKATNAPGLLEEKAFLAVRARTLLLG